MNNSRSQRVLWLLEELGVDYEIVLHTRQPIGLAPPELRTIHPLGKAPIVDIDGYIAAESGAAVELITLRHGRGKLMPDAESPDYPRYIEMLHYAEGSASLPLAMTMFGRLFRVESEAYKAYVKSQVETLQAARSGAGPARLHRTHGTTRSVHARGRKGRSVHARVPVIPQACGALLLPHDPGP